MAALCIGGVCIPYTAIVPAVFLFLKWFFAQFGLSSERDSTSAANGEDGTCTSNCSLKPRRSKLGKSLSAISNASSSGAITGTDGSVKNIESTEEWRRIVTGGGSGGPQQRSIVVKLTADWCRPCKEIDPFYQSLAKKYDATFTRIDVDDLDDVAAELSVAMMPTFVVLDRSGKESGRVAGASKGKLEALIQKHCAERVRS
jgi:thioredoxin 1